MNFEQIKSSFLEYLKNNGKIDDKQYKEMQSSPTSVFFANDEFVQFLKDNSSSFGIKNSDEIPSSIGEILAMSSKDKEEEYDNSDMFVYQESNKTTNETTFNKDYSKNYIKNNYDKSGKLVTQESSVYSVTGTPKSKYITEYNAAGEVNSETQIEFGANADNSVDMAIGYSEQGEKGDCWLLATLNSLSSTEEGQKIIKDAITKNSDGTYSIEFKGVDKKVKITQEELDAAKQSGKYAKGDDDVTLFELGFESIINKIQKGEITVPGNHPGLSVKKGDKTAALAGGNLEDAIFLLTGNDVKSEFKSSGASTDQFDKILSSLKDNPGKYAAILGFSGGENGLTLKDVNGNEICTLEAGTSHAFSIKSVDEDGVTIVNPWDSSKEYKISLADARKYATGIQYYATDDSFKETDTFDSDKLDKQQTQSSEGTQGTDTSTPETTTPDSASTPESNSPSGGNNSPSGGSTTPPVTNPTGDDAGATKDVTNMSEAELSAYKQTQTDELAANQDKYNAIMNGTDKDIQNLKADADKAYEDFQTQLKEKNEQLSTDYDTAKKKVEEKQTQIDENDAKITDTETKLSEAETRITNAESKIQTLTDTISALNAALSSAPPEEQAAIQAKIKQAEEAKAAAEDERDAAIAQRDALQETLNGLNEKQAQYAQELPPLQDEVTRLEGEIAKLLVTTNNPENSDDPLTKSYGEYKIAQQAYETGKADAAKAAKEAIKANQDELNKIAARETEIENDKNKKEFSADKMEKQIDDKLKDLGATGTIDVTKNADGTYSATEKLPGNDKVNGIEVSYKFDKDGNLISYTNAMGTFEANGNNVIYNANGKQQFSDYKDGKGFVDTNSKVLDGVTIDDVIKSIKSSGPQAELFIERALNEFNSGAYKHQDWCVRYSDAVFSSLGHSIGTYSKDVKANNPEINQQSAQTGDIFNNGKSHVGMVLLNIKTSDGKCITITADHSPGGVHMYTRHSHSDYRYFKGISA